MTDSIPNEAKFLQALGVNSDNVLSGTAKVEWINNTPMVYFTMVHAVTPHAVGLAFLAASEADNQPPEADNGTDTNEGDGGGEQ